MIFSIILGVIIILFGLEIALRLTIGFHNPLLYLADPEIGYLLAPNQQVRRFRNRVVINEYSMRSPSLVNPKQGLRILLLGDSVLNGSWWTDQADTISEVIRRNLQVTPFFKEARGNQLRQNSPKSPEKNTLDIEILNASANGWSPRNLLAYVQKFGFFQSDILVLLLNTDDLFGTAPTSIPVGSDDVQGDRYYPRRKPALAIAEAAVRLFVPYTPPPVMAQVNAEEGDRVGFNLTALEAIYQITQTEKSQLIISLTPLWHEVSAQPKDYEILARERLGKFIQDRSIPYLDFLPIFQNHPAPKTLYRDQIHLTSLGNNLVSTEISKLLVGETRHVNAEDQF